MIPTVKMSEKALGRIKKLKDESIEVVQEVCPERARYLTEAYQAHAAEPMIKRRAYALRNVLEKIHLNRPVPMLPYVPAHSAAYTFDTFL